MYGWVREVNEVLLPALQQNKRLGLKKHWRHRNPNCPNYNTIYEWREVYQSRLEQLIKSPYYLPYFSLNHMPDIDPVLYQRLRQLAAEEDNYIVDNSEDFEEVKQNESEDNHIKQAQLLEKAAEVKSGLSFSMYMVEHCDMEEYIESYESEQKHFLKRKEAS